MNRLPLFAAAAILAAPAIAAADTLPGPYVSIGAGANFLQNETVTADPGLTRSRDYRFDTGFAGNGAIGYAFGNGLRLEIEGDYLNNKVDGVTGTLAPRRAGGRQEQYGGLFNVLYDFNLGLPITPYLGLGAGGQIVQNDGINNSSPGFIFPPHSARNPTFSGFAYQGIAGVAYPLPFVPGLSLTADYHFIGLLDPLPSVPVTAFNRAGEIGSGQQKFGNIYNHQVTLGLRYAFGTPPPPPPSPPAAATPVAAPTPEPARTYLVFFDWDRADLTGRARQIIAEAASASSHVQTTRIAVNGYTDLSGTAKYNQGLSVRRAKSVEAELIRDGVARGEITIHGFGETNPLVPTAQGVREPQNRRVEIILR